MEQQRLGILGGMGPQATQTFYQRILDCTAAACDQEHLPTLIFSDTQMPDRTAALLSGRGEEIYQRLLADARLLAQCHCTAIAIPCNTSHYFVDRLQGEVPVPILHMVRDTVKQCKEQGARRVAILATDGTIQTGVYQRECDAQGIEAVAPDGATQALVMHIIYDEIKRGEKGSREKFSAIDQHCRSLGCDSAILGCTELSVFAHAHLLPSYYVDAMEVLTRESILRCGKQLRMV